MGNAACFRPADAPQRMFYLSPQSEEHQLQYGTKVEALPARPQLERDPRERCSSAGSAQLQTSCLYPPYDAEQPSAEFYRDPRLALGFAIALLVIAAAVLFVLVGRISMNSATNPECPPLEELPALWAYAPAAGPEMQVKVLSYNLFWWNLFGVQRTANGAPFRLIENSDKPMPYDLMAFQECEDGALVLRGAQLLDQYTLHTGLGTKTTAICVAFLTRSWEQLGEGSAVVAEDVAGPEHWGARAAQWVRLRHRGLGKTVFFMNHHGPTPVNSGGMCGGAVIANQLLSIIHANALPGDAVVLVGDFNACPGSATVNALLQQLRRVFGGTVDGGIDHIFANAGATRVVAEKNLGGGGSDHDALAVILGL